MGAARKPGWSVCVLLVTSLTAGACGGSTSESPGGRGPTVGATQEEVESACSRSCERRLRCGNTTETTGCVETCMNENFGTAGPSLRSDVVRAYSNCIASLACDGDDDDCEDAMYAVLGFTRAELREQPEVQACFEAAAKCSQNEDTIAEFCTIQMVFVSATRSEFTACYPEPCETQLSCGRRALYGRR